MGRSAEIRNRKIRGKVARGQAEKKHENNFEETGEHEGSKKELIPSVKRTSFIHK
jgi:hypothetical protein|tara:strand:+ start:297 stop:461 length:165 start_codon:yes stop_codon:yes gene_type:complete